MSENERQAINALDAALVQLRVAILGCAREGLSHMNVTEPLTSAHTEVERVREIIRGTA